MTQRYGYFWHFKTSFSTTFWVLFFKKIISHIILYYLTNFIVWLLLLLEILGNMCFVITTLREKCPNTEFFLVRIFLYSDQKKLRHFLQKVSFPEDDIINFEINLAFLSTCFLTWQKTCHGLLLDRNWLRLGSDVWFKQFESLKVAESRSLNVKKTFFKGQ